MKAGAFRRTGLGVHLCLLTALLVVIGLFVGPPGRYSADEGAVLIAAHSVTDGDGWLTPRPLPTVDRTGREYPLVSSDWGERGISAYAKHPAFVVVVAAGEWLAPGWGPMAVSVLGTALAALLAALLARRIDPRTAVVTLWLVGLASPLFVDSFLVMAHTLAAATAVAAVLAADAARRSSRLMAVVWAVATFLAVMVTAMLRTEGLFIGLGLACAMVVVGPVRGRPRHLVVGAAAALGSVAAFLIDRRLLSAIVGAPVADEARGVFVGAGGFVSTRVESLSLTLLHPSYRGGGGAFLLLLAMMLLAVGVYRYSRNPSEPQMPIGLLVAAGLVLVIRALALGPDGVPGLLVAFPLGWMGLVLAGRSLAADGAARVALVTTAVFAVAVAATQYAVGGGVEWGGRYFALAIPLVAPLAAGGLLAAAGRLAIPWRRPAAAGLALVVLGIALLGVRELYESEGMARRFYKGLGTVAAPLGSKPVVVTSAILLPRLAGQSFGDHRWLLADPERPDRLVERLRRAGIEKFVLVTGNPIGDRSLTTGGTRVSSSVIEGWQVDVYRT